MPNHCINIVTVSGPQDSVIVLNNFVHTDKNPFDFNRVAKMPEDILMEGYPSTVEDAKKFVKKHAEGDNPLDFKGELSGFTLTKLDELKKAIESYWKYGFCYWLDWAIANWGTKWNSYEHGDCGPGHYEFLTANGPADEMFKKLSKMFPDVTIHVDFSNEDKYGWQGSMTYKNGEETEEHFKFGSKEAIKFHDEMWGMAE